MKPRESWPWPDPLRGRKGPGTARSGAWKGSRDRRRLSRGNTTATRRATSVACLERLEGSRTGSTALPRIRFGAYLAVMGWTVQRLIDEGYSLGAGCNRVGCHHFGQLDLQTLKGRLGPHHSTMHPDLVPKLRCRKCGSKDVGLIIHPPTRGSELKPGRPSANG